MDADHPAKGSFFHADPHSTVEPQRDAARSLLAAPLAALPQQQLVDLIFGLGMALAVVPATPGRSAIAALKAVAMAAAASQGMAAISAWPEDLRRLTLQRHDAVVGTTGRAVLIRSLRALGDRRIFDAGVTGVMRDALPEAFERSSRALGGIRGPVALARDLLIGAGIDSARLAILDRSGALGSTPTGPARRMHRQYDAHDVAALVAARRNSTTATSLASLWGLPVYAVEQLVLAGELEWEEHPTLLLIEPELRIRKASIAAFASRFDGHVSEVAQPGLITLGRAMRRIGGAPKPWGRVLAGMAGGTIPVSRHRGERAGDAVIDPRTLMSSPDVIAGLRCETGDAGATGPIPLSTTMSQRDACELLNLDNLTIRPLVAAGALSFSRQGRALRVDKAEVIAAAGRIMAASEIGPLLGVRNDAVRSRLRKGLGVPEVEGGWSRSAATSRFGATL